MSTRSLPISSNAGTRIVPQKRWPTT
jgi:hypothetical protein